MAEIFKPTLDFNDDEALLNYIKENYKREVGEILTDEKRQIIQFSEILKDSMEIYEDVIPQNGIITDFVRASISEINFYEIAESWFEDYTNEVS